MFNKNNDNKHVDKDESNIKEDNSKGIWVE